MNFEERIGSMSLWGATNSFPFHLFGARSGGFFGSHDTDGDERRRSPECPLVLIADDEPIIGETLVEILNGEGFIAVAVSDGASAVESAKDLKPDILLADVSMPRLNGIEAAKQILDLFPETRVLLFSGQAETTELLAEARRAGYDFEVLAKPLNPNALLKKLKSPSM